MAKEFLYFRLFFSTEFFNTATRREVFAYIITFFSSLSTANMRLELFKSFRNVERKDFDLFSQAIEVIFYWHLDNELRVMMVKAISYFPAHMYPKALMILKQIADESQIFDALDEYVILANLLHRDEELKIALSQYVIERLKNETNFFTARCIAIDIYDHLDEFCIEENHPLYELALGIILSTDSIDSKKNPYKVYQKTLDASFYLGYEEPLFTTPPGEFFLFAPKVFSQKRGYFLKEEVLTKLEKEYTKHDFDSLKASFLQRVGALSIFDRNHLIQYLEEIFEESPQALLDNLNDYFFEGLLSTPLGDHIPYTTGYFLAILNCIYLQSSVLKPSELLSDQELMLFKMSSSIQNCSIGKTEGLVIFYNALDAKYRFNSSSPSSLAYDTEVFVKEILSLKIQDLLSSDSALMRSMVGVDSEIEQLSHQSVYVKNMLAVHILMPHHLQMDLHTDVLYDDLVNKDIVELLDIFYAHITPLFCAQELILGFNRQGFELKAKHFNGINTFIEDSLPLDAAWDLEEDGSFSLTEKGALQLLLNLGVINSRSSDGPLWLV